MTTYWKFLRAGRISPFTRHRWPEPGEWFEDGSAVPCGPGLHACRPHDLLFWLGDDLWQVELAEPVVATATKVVSRRGRLIAHAPQWSPDAALEFGWACVARTAEHAAAELDLVGLTARGADLRASLAARPVSQQVVAAAAEASRAADAAGHQVANWISGYVMDVAEAVGTYPIASVAYIAARAAALRATPTESAAPSLVASAESERVWQAEWLMQHLALARD